MGPDDGVQRVSKTGLASAGCYAVSIAVWTRSEKVIAEARVFARGPSSEAKGVIETVKVEAHGSDLAIVLLTKKVEEKYGQLNRIRWWPIGDTAIKVGHRVWILQSRNNVAQRVEGVIASVEDGFLGGSGGFVVRLNDSSAVVTYALAGQGIRWDFAAD